MLNRAITVWGRPVAATIMSGELLGTNQDRLAMCRKFAAEAEQLAAKAANPEIKKAYLDLNRQWEELAAELAGESI